MVTDTMEVEQETTRVLSIDTMNFDHGWPWTVLVWTLGLETACIGQIHVP